MQEMIRTLREECKVEDGTRTRALLWACGPLLLLLLMDVLEPLPCSAPTRNAVGGGPSTIVAQRSRQGRAPPRQAR